MTSHPLEARPLVWAPVASSLFLQQEVNSDILSDNTVSCLKFTTHHDLLNCEHIAVVKKVTPQILVQMNLFSLHI